ncbi:MAG: phenylalanine--tRNA ligase subunit beta [Phototrophicales bacterium]|nr:MAG: phenylalanine--tRNA ligase subunit beta [Phototrophicales bacterium]
MRVPLSWLKEFVEIPVDLTIEQIAERLTVAGLEVGKVHYIGVPQSPMRYGVPPSDHLVWDRDKLLMGHILGVKPHPNADRLVLVEVDYGAEEPETVVTGAPNLLDYRDVGTLPEPTLSVLALEGAEVIDGHGDGKQRMILKEKELRGIPNRCMVCSEMELGISDDHEGVILIPQSDLPHVKAGTPAVDVLGDAILDIELTPNLARAFSIIGVAREIAALFDLPFHVPTYDLPPSSDEPIEDAVAIDIREPELNPRFTAALLRNVTIKPSPWWMQWRLKLIGQRPINNIVDVTNYVMFEIGQPTHAFDYDILVRRAGGKKPTIITRLPEAGETLTTLDNKTHQLAPDVLLVADEAGALSLAGVMGGLESEVQSPNDDSVGTTNVLLEAAAWNNITIRKTLSSTKQHSEAAARFSRGVHPAQAILGLRYGAKLMCELSGATLASGILDVYPNPPEPVVVEFPFSEVKRLLGFSIPREEVIGILQRLEFEVREEGDTLWVTVPEHRLDIEVGLIGRADIAEEIARVYGYNNIPDTLMDDALPPQRSNPILEREQRLKNWLAQAGLREVINYRFTTPEHEALLTPKGLASSWPAEEYVCIANPISAERTALRQTLLASLLDNVALNQYHHASQRLFEIASVFYAQPDDLPLEPLRLGIILYGSRVPEDSPEFSTAGNFDFYDLKGLIEMLLESLHFERHDVRFQPIEHNTFHTGRVAALYVREQYVGVLGEVHPLVREAFDLGLDLNKPALAAELDLDVLYALMPDTFAVRPIPIQPPVYRDIALVMDESWLAADVEALIWQYGSELLRDVRLFDVYRGDPIPAGKKSMAYTLTFQTDETTLNDKVVNNIQKSLVKALAEHGLVLRS